MHELRRVCRCHKQAQRKSARTGAYHQHVILLDRHVRDFSKCAEVQVIAYCMVHISYALGLCQHPASEPQQDTQNTDCSVQLCSAARGCSTWECRVLQACSSLLDGANGAVNPIRGHICTPTATHDDLLRIYAVCNISTSLQIMSEAHVDVLTCTPSSPLHRVSTRRAESYWLQSKRAKPRLLVVLHTVVGAALLRL